MKIIELLTPIAEVQWLAATDTVRDALDHIEAYELNAAPILDWNGRYLGTITAADLQRHVAGAERSPFATQLSDVERRSHNDAVVFDRDVAVLVEHAVSHPFVPVVDGAGKLLGIVDRRRILETRRPTAA